MTKLFGLDACRVWDTESAFEHLRTMGQADTKRTAERSLHELALLPPELRADSLEDESGRKPIKLLLDWELDKARSKRKLVLFAQLSPLPGGRRQCLHANDARGGRFWLPLDAALSPETIACGLQLLQNHIGKEIVVFPHAGLLRLMRDLPALPVAGFSLLAYPPVLPGDVERARPLPITPHLKRLEAESIHIIREAVAEAENPVMLYSVGKDSSVMLHLARKAFFPASPPFPLMHVDTRWKFQEMYLFREYMAQVTGMDLLVHVNPEAVERDIIEAARICLNCCSLNLQCSEGL